MENQDIKIVLDIETTGLDYRREKIIEFAGVKLVNNEITEEFETLINPQQEIRQSSINIHGITQEMVADAPTLEEAMPKILDFIKDYTIIGHNVIFDYSFLKQACRDLYGHGLDNHRIDTQHMFREVFPDEFSHGLDALMRRFKVEFDVRHRAMADAKGLALAYPRLKELYDRKYEWQLSQLKNIDYLFERYLRIQQTVQALQAELSDIKSIFKVYFDEGGKDIQSTTGELLTCQSKYSYSYDFEQIKDTLEEIGAYEKAVKLNNGFIDRMIRGSSLEDYIREKLSQARTQISESKSVIIVKPDKNFITNGNGE
ncbi:MAG: hypothetical protein A2287_11145 [Candidatus Melainabacteria bacterium RIFOXYA12_FULL_32_12]|nr:MAG: hypothetical protein A2104_02785 [Candidatus Melainabacteria bacterium GWF2_32_7]OGI22023.1 MAG: hypothetical protein A2255_00970 [Candidatus Melainabacteria bacterium RIFOXYA2_FULL_32_9]OGI29805.1 MAG: hypothetical protein A2287_11145 [Candidatus Melainabacteria bacterium RIFOXYA12_FULL_32_12]